MGTADRAVLVSELRESRDAFLGALDGIREDQARFKPGPERWSIEECAEHVALVEKRLLRRIIEESVEAERNERPERQEEVRRGALNRSTPRPAPGPVHPTGQFGSLAKALEQFAANRDVTIAYVTDCKDDFHARTIVHPVGPMTCHECFVLMTNHPLRHIEQVREIQATPGYPG